MIEEEEGGRSIAVDGSRVYLERGKVEGYVSEVDGSKDGSGGSGFRGVDVGSLDGLVARGEASWECEWEMGMGDGNGKGNGKVGYHSIDRSICPIQSDLIRLQ